jgi:HPt (histidine-containing phosphotransfer) domain-containing protein
VNAPDPNGGAAQPAVDFDQLQSACDGDVVLMRELVDMYFNQADEIMAGLKKAIDDNAVAQVDHLSHKLAGSSLACGFSAVVPSLRQLEHNAKAGHINGGPQWFAQAATQLEVVRNKIRDYLPPSPP